MAFDLGSLHDVCAHRFTPKAQLNGFKSIDECVLALQSGRVDAEILAATIGLSTSRQESDPRAVPPAEHASRFASELLWDSAGA